MAGGGMAVTPLRPTQSSLKTRIDEMRQQIEACLASAIPAAETWPRALHEAQRHALLSPGKRFRPLLTVFLTEGCGGSETAKLAAVDVGCVVEMVHAASLILDDLPCMDDADLRRNQPTTHVAFGESTAILSATALLNRAFGIISRLNTLSPEQRVELSDLLSFSVGSTGLIAGQMADLYNTGDASVTEVERVNQLKTGALFDFAADAAAILAGSPAAQRAALKDFSRQIGLAFQSLDDVKDVLQSHLESGKSAGRDTGKTTLLAKEGLADTKARLEGYMDSARMALTRANLSNAPTLDYIVGQQFSFLDAL
jgi:geranylgeranyl diphosphate synthase type II